MARTPYRDEEAEKFDADLKAQSSTPQGQTNDMTDNYMDNQDMARHRSNIYKEDWVREKDSEIQAQRNKRRNK